MVAPKSRPNVEAAHVGTAVLGCPAERRVRASTRIIREVNSFSCVIFFGNLWPCRVEINRDPYELLRLAPGVFGDGARYGDGRSAGFPNGSGAVSASAGPGGSNTAIFQVENQQPISANGQRVTSNDYLVDGVSVNSGVGRRGRHHSQHRIRAGDHSPLQ